MSLASHNVNERVNIIRKIIIMSITSIVISRFYKRLTKQLIFIIIIIIGINFVKSKTIISLVIISHLNNLSRSKI